MQRTLGALLVATLLLATPATMAHAETGSSKPAAHPEPRVDSSDFSFYRRSSTTEPYPLTSAGQVSNVILCIGDGMGVSQVALARMKAAGLGGKLHMERLPVSGSVQTHSANSRVTDSAAAGTALATGVKTKNGMIGMSPEKQEYCTILEAAKATGMATGLVATSSITDATPASFGAHVKSRRMEDRIVEQLLGVPNADNRAGGSRANKVDVLLGGGRKFFLPWSDPNSARRDRMSLLAAARNAGYKYVETAEELQSIRHRPLLGLFQLDALTTLPPEPSLALLTEKAIQALTHANDANDDSEKGFFLMVEGSQIDWACHANDAKAAIRQILLFDQAVKAAVDFALRDGHTLVIVVADHETGGLTLVGGGDEDKGDAELTVHWSTRGHTGLPVPIYALGPGAQRFAGVCDNTDIPKRIALLLNIRPFPRPAKWAENRPLSE